MSLKLLHYVIVSGNLQNLFAYELVLFCIQFIYYKVYSAFYIINIKIYIRNDLEIFCDRKQQTVSFTIVKKINKLYFPYCNGYLYYKSEIQMLCNVTDIGHVAQSIVTFY